MRSFVKSYVASWLLRAYMSLVPVVIAKVGPCTTSTPTGYRSYMPAVTCHVCAYSMSGIYRFLIHTVQAVFSCPLCADGSNQLLPNIVSHCRHRSKAFIASLSSPSTAVQQAEQKAEHALSLRKFQQAVQEPAVAQQPASPLSPGKKVGLMGQQCRVAMRICTHTQLSCGQSP